MLIVFIFYINILNVMNIVLCHMTYVIINYVQNGFLVTPIISLNIIGLFHVFGFDPLTELYICTSIT